MERIMKRKNKGRKMTSAVGYIRVSTEDQAASGLGLAAQRTAITAECERRGWALVSVHEDAGLSGKSTRGRDGLTAALAAIDNGEADTLVVAKLDRLSRSLADFASIMDRAKRDGWNLVALDLGIDLSTPSGEFLASIMASAAQWERHIIGERTRDALAERKAQGVVLGRPRTLDPRTRRRIIGSFKRGSGLTAIATRLNDERVPTAAGGRRWYPSTVRAVLVSEGVLGAA